jgi:hypothetical protein
VDRGSENCFLSAQAGEGDGDDLRTFWRNKVQVLCIVIFFTNKLQC